MPHKCANTTVTINISQDKDAPVFSNPPFITTINENYVVGQQVIVVRAIDSNPLVSAYLETSKQEERIYSLVKMEI